MKSGIGFNDLYIGRQMSIASMHHAEWCGLHVVETSMRREQTMAITTYTQTNPTIFGVGAIAVVGEKVKELGGKKVLLVTDSGLLKAGIAKKVQDNLEAAGLTVVVFSEISPDPKDHEVEKGGEFARAQAVDAAVAVGGGSVLDAAKGIAMLGTNPSPISKYYGNWDYKKPLPLVCIPTTSGTGSENTIYGVITDSATGAKKVILTTASLAICDPELTYTLPKDMTGSTGLDAFAHAAESLTCNIPNPKSDLLDIKAIELIMKWLPIAVFEPTNKEARQNMMLASNFAGMGFTDTCCHLGHAFSQCMGARFHVAHGISCAWALPEVMRYSAQAAPERVKLVADAMGLTYPADITGEALGDLVADAIHAFMRKLEVRSIKDYGFTREDTVGISGMVMQDNCFPFIPSPLNEESVKKVLGRIYDTYQ
jgi:alcohol dehydrogenase class IV